MMDETGIDVAGLDIAVAWNDYDATAWRNHPEPDGDEFEDDDDGPCPPDVVGILGFDPDDLE